MDEDDNNNTDISETNDLVRDQDVESDASWVPPYDVRRDQFAQEEDEIASIKKSKVVDSHNGNTGEGNGKKGGGEGLLARREASDGGERRVDNEESSFHDTRGDEGISRKRKAESLARKAVDSNVTHTQHVEKGKVTAGGGSAPKRKPKNFFKTEKERDLEPWTKQLRGPRLRLLLALKELGTERVKTSMEDSLYNCLTPEALRVIGIILEEHVKEQLFLIEFGSTGVH